jgi:two-component system nitrate/nitrite response regulator NarL
VHEKISIFVLAGNRLFRESLARILKSKSDMVVVGCGTCTAESLAQVESSRCDVLLVDPVNGDLADLSLIRDLAKAAPEAKIVLIDMLDEESTFLKAVRAGVVGYVLQSASALDIVAAVRSVHQDEAVCPPHLCLALFRYVARGRESFSWLRPKAQTGLTRREQQLVPLIAQGFTNKEIASHLNLSEQTVKNHIHRILQRIGVSDRLAVVQRMRQQESTL